jgi:mitochondrial enoyl-[acyl-carrier protein] reductase / trans-2-enoyl-CoA reductase
MRNDATMVTYGGMSREPVTIPTSLFIFKNLKLNGFWLNKWFLDRPVQARIDIYQHLFDLVRKQKYKEIMHEKWSWSKLDDSALQTIANRPDSDAKVLKRILVE